MYLSTDATYLAELRAARERATLANMPGGHPVAEPVRLRRISPAETTPLLKRALRAAFPGVRFSVRLSRGTAHGNVHVSYSSDLDNDELDRIVCRFSGQSFDGFDDSTNYESAPIEFDGETVQSGLNLILTYRS